MPITINGTGSIDGISSGGLNDGIITPSELSTGAPSWNSSGVFSFNSGYGSVATAYGCRAWVNFNGTGTVGSNQTIRASAGVTSVSKSATGRYGVNFSFTMPDANFSQVGTCKDQGGGIGVAQAPSQTNTTSAGFLQTVRMSPTAEIDSDFIWAAFFR